MSYELRYYSNCPHCQRRLYVTFELDELKRGIECKCPDASCRQMFLIRSKVSEVPVRATNTGGTVFTSPSMATEFKRV